MFRPSTRSSAFATWAAANRDPELFADPHEVRLDRANASQNLTFGAGTHRCLGLELARLAGKLAIRAILDRARVLQYRSKGFVAGWSAVPAELR